MRELGMADHTPMIDDYMTRELVTFAPTDDIHKAIELLIGNRISGAPVVDEHGCLVGILTKQDCFKVVFQSSYHQDWGGHVADFMSPQVETLASGMNVIAAAETFAGSQFKSYPVLNEGRLVGIVSRLDILRALDDLWH